jgi:uncharacterized Tic20 family protein
LEVDISIFTGAASEEKEKREMVHERTWLGLIHLSGVLLLIFPTIIVWNKQKDTIKGISDHFWDVINFQSGSLILVVIPGLLSLIFAGKPYFIIMILLLRGITSIMNAMKVFNGRSYKYFFFFKLKKAPKKETKVSYWSVWIQSVFTSVKTPTIHSFCQLVKKSSIKIVTRDVTKWKSCITT